MLTDVTFAPGASGLHGSPPSAGQRFRSRISSDGSTATVNPEVLAALTHGAVQSPLFPKTQLWEPEPATIDEDLQNPNIATLVQREVHRALVDTNFRIDLELSQLRQSCESFSVQDLRSSMEERLAKVEASVEQAHQDRREVLEMSLAKVEALVSKVEKQQTFQEHHSVKDFFDLMSALDEDGQTKQSALAMARLSTAPNCACARELSVLKSEVAELRAQAASQTTSLDATWKRVKRHEAKLQMSLSKLAPAHEFYSGSTGAAPSELVEIGSPVQYDIGGQMVGGTTEDSPGSLTSSSNATSSGNVTQVSDASHSQKMDANSDVAHMIADLRKEILNLHDADMDVCEQALKAGICAQLYPTVLPPSSSARKEPEATPSQWLLSMRVPADAARQKNQPTQMLSQSQSTSSDSRINSGSATAAQPLHRQMSAGNSRSGSVSPGPSRSATPNSRLLLGGVRPQTAAISPRATGSENYVLAGSRVTPTTRNPARSSGTASANAARPINITTPYEHQL